jgi:maleate cis-trans isomerase
MRSAAGVSLCGAAGAAIDLIAGPARAANYRGVVGDIKPRATDSGLVDMIRLLPEGIGVIPVFLNLTQGTREEYLGNFDSYEKNIAYLAAQKCNVIAIEGAPPFMILGPDAETKMIDGWKQKYRTDMFTSSQNQVNAFRALKARKVLGITAAGADLNRSYAKYFQDCGIGIVAMEGMDVDFKSIPDIPPAMITAFTKKKFAEHKDADAIWFLGSALEALPLIAPLERELKVPVVQAIAARIWEIQKRLNIHEPIKGYGRLLETLPV